MGEVKEKLPCQEDVTRAAVSRRINHCFVVLIAFSLFIYGAVWMLALDIQDWMLPDKALFYLGYVLCHLSIVWLVWIGARWYCLRPGSVQEIEHRYAWLIYGKPRNPPISWDTWRRPRRLWSETDGEYMRADAWWVVGGMTVIVVLGLAAVAIFLLY